MAENNKKEVMFKAEGLKVWFPITKGIFKKVIGHVKAVDGVDVEVYKGETLGIVGESGCGKTTVGKAIMMLEKPTAGKVLFNYDGEMRDVTQFKKKDLFNFRRKVQMVFQDPYSALNPMKKVSTAMNEPLKIHGFDSQEKRDQVINEVLDLVNIPRDYLNKYPHEFSGGQRQRVCIARALEIGPEVLVCDEAVSALDVSIQAQVLNLLKEIQKQRNLTFIFIAHDLSVVQYMSDRIAVMYLGKVVEIADSRELHKSTLHPYTQSLLSAVPMPVLNSKKKRIILKGDVPSPINKPSGCPFHERCDRCMDICKEVEPPLVPYEGRHEVACHLYPADKNPAAQKAKAE